MWVFTESGFISAVMKDEYGDLLAVRARDRASLENIGQQTGAEIKTSPLSDYPYRVFISRHAFDIWACNQIAEIDYRNFKNAVHLRRGQRYSQALSDVWATMHLVEDSSARGNPGLTSWKP